MNQDEIRNHVEKVLDESETGTMATVKNNKPHSRYMTFFHKDFILYTVTDQDTDKTEEIEKNPHTHLMIGYEGEGFGDEYVEIAGEVRFNDSADIKKELWSDEMGAYFKGPDDPDFTVLEIHPASIRLMNRKGGSPVELEM